jgi:hypothetical protein
MADFPISVGMRVYVVEDCTKQGREGFGTLIQYGIDWSTLIRLDDGREIHGYDCWWYDGVIAEKDLREAGVIE